MTNSATCPGCGQTRDQHCPTCLACSPDHRCQPARQETFNTVHPSSGLAVTGERRP